MSSTSRDRRAYSLRFQLLVALVLITLLSTTVVSLLSYRAARRSLTREVFRALDISGQSREVYLRQLLQRRHDRVGAFLRELPPLVSLTADESLRLQRPLAEFMLREGATGLRLSRSGQAPVLIGDVIDRDPPQGPELAHVASGGGRPHYLVTEADGAGGLMTLRFDTRRDWNPAFLDRYALGDTGEAFIVDGRGYFLTTPRYAAGQGIRAPIGTEAMRRCLSGANGQMLAKDYRGADVVNAFRHFAEIGGGSCIAVHIDQREAFQTLDPLARNVATGILLSGLTALGVSLLLAARLTRPLARLARSASALEAGDFDQPIHVQGPEEVRAFARSFAAMVGAIKHSRLALETSVAETRKELAQRQQAEEVLRKTQADLETRVGERTVDLRQVNEALGAEIVERRRVEEELLRQQQFLQAVLDKVEDGIVACEAAGTLSFANRAMREFYELGDQPLPIVGWERYLEQHQPDGKTLVVREQMPLFRALDGEAVQNLERTIVPKRGTPRSVLVSGRPLIDTYGRKQGAVMVVHDITERKRADEERAARAREQLARQEAERASERSEFLGHASQVLSSSLDFHATLTSLAQLAVPRLADWCAVDVMGADQMSRRLAVAHVDSSKVELGFELSRRYPIDVNDAVGSARTLRSGRSELHTDISDERLASTARDPGHLEILRTLGVKSAMVVPLSPGGRTLGAITFVSATAGRFHAADLAVAEELAHRASAAVENARLYRELQEADRMKDEFLAMLSHELRTPLNAILGWTQMLRSGAVPPEGTSRALETIERNAKTQTQLIADLLDVSRIVTGKLLVNMETVELPHVVHAALESVRPAADAKQIRLETAFDERSGPVMGDPDRLQQVVWNLLSNAVKFTPEGGRVRIRLGRDNEHVEIRVADTGEGISPEVIPHIFERFRQANSTTTRAHGGLGLGLAIVRHLVELHGGTVEARSQGPGKGAMFTVRLPVVPAQQQPDSQHAVARTRYPSADELHGVRILVVDDEPDARTLMAELLRSGAADVAEAASVAEAMAVVERWRPHLVLADIGMPEEDGYDLIRRLRARDAERGERTPAIAVTAYARSEDRTRALRAGFQSHLSKPIEPAELVAVIASIVGRAATPSQT